MCLVKSNSYAKKVERINPYTIFDLKGFLNISLSHMFKLVGHKIKFYGVYETSVLFLTIRKEVKTQKSTIKLK